MRKNVSKKAKLQSLAQKKTKNVEEFSDSEDQ